MKRRAFLAGMAALSPGCGRSRRRLNVYNWSDYIARKTIPAFEREFAVQVRYGTYEAVEEMYAKVMSGNSGWDVVFPSNSYIAPMRQMALLAPLDHQLLPNIVNLDDRFRAPFWDPKLECCLPYMHGATGIVYSKAAPAPKAWADLWTARYRGRMTMLDDSAEVFAACLKRLGYSVNATDRAQLNSATRLALEQKPFLRAYLNAEVRDQLIAGDVLAAQSWSVTAQQAVEQSARLAFVYPSEGFPLYCDCAVILRESAHKELAHAFLNYLLRPDVAAAIATEMRTATANGSARRLLSAKDRDNPTLYPPEDILARGEWFTALPASAERIRDRLWTEIKSG